MNPYVGIIQIRLWVEILNFLSACPTSSPIVSFNFLSPIKVFLSISQELWKVYNFFTKLFFSIFSRKDLKICFKCRGKFALAVIAHSPRDLGCTFMGSF